MSLPNTLEEMQYQILQGDLSDNPYLQPHVISSKDKELKTKAKKIIPAINEILKTIQVVSGTIQGFTEEVNITIEALREELKAYVDKGIEETVKKNSKDIEVLQELMEEYMNHSLQQKITALEQTYDQKFAGLNEQIAALNEVGAGTGGNELKRVFHSSMELGKNGSIIAPLKLQDIQDLDKQIEVLRFSQMGNVYILDKNPFNLKSSSTSLYQMYTYPLNLIVNHENGEIRLTDKAGLDKYIINFYTME